jgi:hypothetical protein
MHHVRLLIFFFFVFLLSVSAYAQKNTVVFGIHIEPVIPSRMFRIQTEDIVLDQVEFSIIPKTGYLFGTHLSLNVSKRFTIESGINLIKRDISIEAREKLYDTSLTFNIHNFEIPLASTFYVRLAERLYMGQTVGISFQMLPSHLTSKLNWVDSAGTISRFEQISIRRSWLVPSFKGGVGFEYRSEESGFFYIGAMYHLFTKMYNTQITYKTSAIDELFEVKPQSDFFGIMFRYSFPPSPLLKNTKKEKKPKTK